MSWQQLQANLRDLAEKGRPERPWPALRYPGPPDHDEQPSVFVRFWLALAAFVVFVLGALCYFVLPVWWWAPDYRWAESRAETASSAVAPGPDETVWSSSGNGVHRFDPGALFWNPSITYDTTGGGLPANDVRGLDVSARAIAYVCRQNLWRTLTLSDRSDFPGRKAFCAVPPFNATHCGDNTDGTVTCVADWPFNPVGRSDGSPYTGRLLGVIVGCRSAAENGPGGGVSIYSLLSPDRTWIGPFTQAGQQLSDDRVNDLLWRAAGELLVATNAGLDLVSSDGVNWKLKATIPGLASKGVVRLLLENSARDRNVPPTDALGRPGDSLPPDARLIFQSLKHGVGAMAIRPHGEAAEREIIVSEGRVPGLELAKCRHGAYSKEDGLLWAVFEVDGALWVARHRFSDHDWDGSSGPLKDRQVHCLSTAELRRSCLAGTSNGVLQVREDLTHTFCGPDGEQITELAGDGKRTFAHAVPSQAGLDSVPRVRFAEPRDGTTVWLWQDLIGPGRFPGLSAADITCIAPDTGGARARSFFGTRGKGLGALYPASHEVVPAPFPDLKEKTILDLASAPRSRLWAADGDHALLTYNGAAWRTAISAEGLKGTAETVVCAAGPDSSLAVATASSLGLYSLFRHAWTPLPELPEARRLHCLDTWLWALQRTGDLHVCSIGPGTPGKWARQASGVRAMAGTSTLLAVLHGDGVARLSFATAGADALLPVISPQPLKSELGTRWTHASALGTCLYLRSDNGVLACYDLAGHSWETLPPPPSGGALLSQPGAAEVSQLEATAAGLWLLTPSGDLYLLKSGAKEWGEKPFLYGVQSLHSDGKDVLARLKDGALFKLDGTNAETLIGRPAGDNPAEAVAAAEVQRLLFLGTSAAVIRYDRGRHDLTAQAGPSGELLKSFAPTSRFLYTLWQHPAEETGHVVRFHASQAGRELLTDGQEQELRAARLASSDEGVALYRDRADVLAVMDETPETLSHVYPYSQFTLGGEPISSAAEAGEELYLASRDGLVTGYESGSGNLPRWTQPCSVGMPVRKLVLADDGRQRALAGPQGVVVQKRTGRGAAWQRPRKLRDAGDCDVWDAGGGKLLIGERPAADSQPALFDRVAVEAPEGGPAIHLVGPACSGNQANRGTGILPVAANGPTVAVAELRTGSGYLLLRADADAVGMYDGARHAWDRVEIAGVKRFLNSLGTVWAYAPRTASLYKFVPSDGRQVWERYASGKKIVDVAGDASGLLLRYDDGRVELLEQGAGGAVVSRCLVGEIPEPVRAHLHELSCWADTGSLLLCSFSSGATCRYDPKTHLWRIVTLTGGDGAGIRQFARTGRDAQELYGITHDDKLVQWLAQREQFEVVSTPAAADRLATCGDRFYLSTKDGGLYERSGSGWKIIVGSEQRLAGERWPALTAAAEHDGVLVLGLADGRLAAYHPGSRRWREARLAGGATAEQFLKCVGRLYVVASAGAARRLFIYDVAGNAVSQVPSYSVRCVAAAEDEMGVIVADGTLQALDPASKTLKPVAPNVRLSLPAGVPVSAVRTVGGTLLVFLADRSVWQHGEKGLGWTLVSSDAGPTVSPLLCTVNNHLLLLTPAGELLRFDSEQDRYVPAAGDLAAAAPATWRIRSDGGRFTVRADDDGPWLTLGTETLSPSAEDAPPLPSEPVAVRAAGDDLAVTLHDGSVWHHGSRAWGWRRVSEGVAQRDRKVPPAAPAVIFELNGWVLWSTPRGGLQRYDPEKNQAVPVEPALPARPPEPDKWRVSTAAGENGWLVQLPGCAPGVWMALSKTPLSIDSLTGLSVDRKVLNCTTSAGPFRVIDRERGEEVRVAPADDAALNRMAQRRHALTLDSPKLFGTRAGGPWPAADQSRYTVVVKPSGEGGQDEELRPHADGRTIGLGTQWVSQPVAKGQALMVAVPGGVARLESRDGALLAGTPVRLTDDEQVIPELSLGSDGLIYCRLGESEYRVLSADQRSWQRPADLKTAEEAFGAAARFRSGAAPGPTWSHTEGAGGPGMKLTTGDGRPHELRWEAGKGFGLDLVTAMSLTQDTIELYTRQGLAVFKRSTHDGVPLAIREDRAITAAAAHHSEYLLDSEFCRWRADEEVELRYPGKAAVRTCFDRATGRFRVDEIVALGALHGTWWGVTRGGIRQLDPSGAVSVSCGEDSAFAGVRDASFVVAPQGGKEQLYARVAHAGMEQPAVFRLDPDAGTWSKVAAGESEAARVSAADEWLLRGRHWRVKRDQINASGAPGAGMPRLLHRHWGFQKPDEFMEVALDAGHERRPGAFDFERVNDILLHGAQLWAATDRGVVQMDLRTRTITGLSEPGGERRVARLYAERPGGTVYAETATGVFSWNASAAAWLPTTAKPAPSAVLLDSPDWRIERRDSGLRCAFRLAATDRDLTSVSFCSSGPGLYRFDFDTVTAVAASQNVLALATEFGLVQRVGAAQADTKPARLPEGMTAKPEKLFTAGQREKQEVFCQHGEQTAVYSAETNSWVAVAREQAGMPALLTDHELVLTWNGTWRVVNPALDGGRGLAAGHDPLLSQVYLRVGTGTDYRFAHYNRGEGLFAFDHLRDAAVCEDGDGKAVSVFVATEAGVMRLSRDGRWERWYCYTSLDGMPYATVERLAGLSRLGLMAQLVPDPYETAGRPRFYRLLENDQWQEAAAEPGLAEEFALRRATLAHDPQGWSILDRALLNADGPAASEPRASASGDENRSLTVAARKPGTGPAGMPALLWQDQPVWLVQDGGQIRFAHDVVYSVAAGEQDVWLGTAGGALRYRSQGGAEGLGLPAIHAREFLAGAPAKQEGPAYCAAPPAVGLIRTLPAAAGVACFLLPPAKADGVIPEERVDTDACYVLTPAGTAFEKAPPGGQEHAAALRARRGIDDSFWHWTKLGPATLEIGLKPEAADLPAGGQYQLIENGTFRFWDTQYRPERRRRERTMLYCRDTLFLATRGGIMSFDGNGSMVKLYAATRPDSGQGAAALENIRQLFLHGPTNTLYAQDGDGTAFGYEPPAGGDHGSWAPFAGPRDPFADADIVQNDRLLLWRQKEDGATARPNCSDLRPEASYPTLAGGKFSFDEVYAVALKGDELWLATLGGVVRMDRRTHSIHRIYADAFLAGTTGSLPEVHEVIVGRQDKALYARAKDKRCYRLEGETWKALEPALAEPVFRGAYTKVRYPEKDPFWTWVQEPQRVYVELHKTQPAGLLFGNTPGNHAPLLSRGRFTWDDVREAVLAGNDLLFTTPAGVACYIYDPERRTVQYSCLYGALVSEPHTSMRDVERLVREPDGTVLTWNSTHVFRGTSVSPGRWIWELDARSPAWMTSRKDFRVAGGAWGLQRQDGKQTVQVTFARADGSLDSADIDAGREIPDLSRAVFTKHGIWCPAERGLLWIDTVRFRRQKLLLPLAWACLALLALAGVVTLAVSLRARRRRP